MSSVKVDVIVREGPLPIETVSQRPVRLTPVGTAGVVYGGVVFELDADHVIDLAGATWDKADCSRFVTDPLAIPYAVRQPSALQLAPAVARWAVERTRYATYLVFDGDEDLAEAVVDLLIENGLGVKSWDASYRPSADGVQYAWYARLETHFERAEAHRLVENLLADQKGASHGSSTSETITVEQDHLVQGLLELEKDRQHLRVQVENLTRRAEGAEAASTSADKQLTAALSTIASLNDQIRDLHNVADEAARRLAGSEAANAVLRAAQDAVHAGAQGAIAAVVDAARREYDDLIAVADQEHYEHSEHTARTEQDLADKDRYIRQLEAEVVGYVAGEQSAKQQIADLQAQLAEIRDQERERAHVDAGKRARQAATGRKRSDELLLQRLLPNLEIHSRGMDDLVSVDDPRGMFDVLYRLDAGEDPGGKVLQGTGGLRIKEVRNLKVGGANGNADMGRVYYSLDGQAPIAVRPHHKGDDADQRQVINTFTRWCRTRASRAA